MALTRDTDPTHEELADGVRRLTAEIDHALASNRWAFLEGGSEQTLHRIYDAAALRHCEQLLGQIELSACAEQELTVRILGRAHIEAWLFALYIHFGGYPALKEIAQDTLHGITITNDDLARHDQQLAAKKKQQRGKLRKVNETNAGIAKWNIAHPDSSPKPFRHDPHVPRLARTDIDLNDRIADFTGLDAKRLPVSTLADKLTALAQEKGFGQESFYPIYLVYRLQSGTSIHPTINIYDAYCLPPSAPGGFVRIAPHLTGGSLIKATRITALYSTAFLAAWVLGDAGSDASVANELRGRLEPDPTEGRGWAPGG